MTSRYYWSIMIGTIVLMAMVATLHAQPDTAAQRAFGRLSTAIGANAPTDSVSQYYQQWRTAVLRAQTYDIYAKTAQSVAERLYQSGRFGDGLLILEQLDDDLGTSAPLLHAQWLTTVAYQRALGYYYERDNANAHRQLDRYPDQLDPASLEYAQHQHLLGLLQLEEGRYRQAQQTFEEVVRLRESHYGNQDNRITSALNGLGEAYYRQGLLNRAEIAFGRALDIRTQALGTEDYRRYSLLSNLGVVLDEKGDYFKSMAAYQKAIELLQNQPDAAPEELATLYINLGVSLFKNGSIQEAQAYQRRAAVLLRERGAATLLGDAYTNLANLAAYRGDYQSADDLQRSALEQYRSNSLAHPDKQWAALENIGVYHLEQQQYEQALAILLPLADTLSLTTAFDNVRQGLFSTIGDAYLKSGAFALARDYYSKALQLQNSLYGVGDFRTAYPLNKLAIISRQQGQRDEALRLVDLSLQVNSRMLLGNATYRNYETYLEALLLKGSLMDGAEARAVYGEADAVLAEIKSRLLLPEDKVHFAQYVKQLSGQAIQLLTQDNEIAGVAATDEMLYFMELSKANVLSQLLTINQGKLMAGIPADSLRMEETLHADISYYNLRLSTETDTALVAAYSKELLAVQRVYERLQRDFATRYPDYHALMYSQGAPTVTQVQSRLAPHSALISYFTTEKQVYSLVITTETVRFYQTTPDERLAEKLRGLHKTINLRLDQDYTQLAHELYQLLLPTSLPPAISELIIASDVELQQVPFEVLLREAVPSEKSLDFRQLAYLVQDYDITYVPSVDIFLKGTQTQEVSYTQELMAFAPVFADSQQVASYETTLRAPLSDQPEILRSVSRNGTTITPLPASLREIADIAQLFDQQSKAARSYTYDQASEATLKENLQQPNRFIHIATHGFVNELQPDLSGLLLYPTSSKEEDHILYSGEIYDLSLQTDLVVLSACETGLGKRVRGEGVMGLSRAFLYAGAPHLLVSLWKVQDEATSQLMVEFYRQYWQVPGHTYAHYLRAAKQHLIASEQYSHPYYWSPFIMIGN